MKKCQKEIQNDSCKRTNVTGDIKFYLGNVELERASLNKGKRNKNKIRTKKKNWTSGKLVTFLETTGELRTQNKQPNMWVEIGPYCDNKKKKKKDLSFCVPEQMTLGIL